MITVDELRDRMSIADAFTEEDSYKRFSALLSAEYDGVPPLAENRLEIAMRRAVNRFRRSTWQAAVMSLMGTAAGGDSYA